MSRRQSCWCALILFCSLFLWVKACWVSERSSESQSICFYEATHIEAASAPGLALHKDLALLGHHVGPQRMPAALHFHATASPRWCPCGERSLGVSLWSL